MKTRLWLKRSCSAGASACNEAGLGFGIDAIVEFDYFQFFIPHESLKLFLLLPISLPKRFFFFCTNFQSLLIGYNSGLLIVGHVVLISLILFIHI